MKQYSIEVYDYWKHEDVILTTDTPITERKGEGFTRCRRCNFYTCNSNLYNYKDSIYCSDCLIALVKESKI